MSPIFRYVAQFFLHYLEAMLFGNCQYFCHQFLFERYSLSYLSSLMTQILFKTDLRFSSFSRKVLPPQSEMTSVFLSHRSDFTFLSAFPSSYLIFQFLAFDPNSRFKTQISSSKRFTSVKDKVPKMYRVSQKNALSECCWSHSALAQSPFAGTPCVWRFVSF